jgi:hypothetical protein
MFSRLRFSVSIVAPCYFMGLVIMDVSIGLGSVSFVLLCCRSAAAAALGMAPAATRLPQEQEVAL